MRLTGVRLGLVKAGRSDVSSFSRIGTNDDEVLCNNIDKDSYIIITSNYTNNKTLNNIETILNHLLTYSSSLVTPQEDFRWTE